MAAATPRSSEGSWTALRAWLESAGVDYEEPADIAETAAEIIAANGVVAWFQGRSEYGPRALGHRSLLASAADPANVQRLNDIKGRERFRRSRRGSCWSVRPRSSRAARCRARSCSSPIALVRPGRRAFPRPSTWTAPHGSRPSIRWTSPLAARLLKALERRTGIPLVVNTSLNTAGRPMVDDPRDALECFGSAPVAGIGTWSLSSPTAAPMASATCS